LLFIVRHIDAALIYQNQEEVGRGIKNSGVPREEIFLVSKANHHQQAARIGLTGALVIL
jgi:diketogulonate reductase-like aldo/keto reductase